MLVVGKVCGEEEQPAPVLRDDKGVCFLAGLVWLTGGILKCVARTLGAPPTSFLRRVEIHPRDRRYKRAQTNCVLSDRICV